MRWNVFQNWLANIKLRTKIHLVLLSLFAIMATTGILVGGLLDRISTRSIALIQDNQRSMKYTREMSLALNDLIAMLTVDTSGVNSDQYRRINLRKYLDRFETYLRLQEGNTSMQGEVIGQLRQEFERFKTTLNESQSRKELNIEVVMQSFDMQGVLRQVYQASEESVQLRLRDANNMANQATLFMIGFGFIFFLLAILSMIYFPSYILRPIDELTRSIREIARRNYSQRLPVNSHDELGLMAHSFNEMASKLDEYEQLNVQKLLSEKSRIETIINQMNEAIVGLDGELCILFANRTALRLLGCREEELVGESATALAEQHPLLRELVHEIQSNEAYANRLYPAISLEQHGKKYYFEKDVLHVAASTQEAREGFVVILKNVTTFKEQELVRSNFIATVSHELKTPISAIDMSMGLLQDARIGALNEEQQELSGTVKQNTARLLKMVNELLEMSRIEAGQIEFDQDEVQPGEIVERAFSSIQMLFKEKQVAVDIKMEDSLPQLTVDLQKTTGVLINFLTNALRYSKAGDRIGIEVVEKEGAICFMVSDEGPGVPYDDQRRIFKRYQRAKDDQTAGTGLGLAISKEFVQKQGGQIWVRSEPGQGSTFGFSLPVECKKPVG